MCFGRALGEAVGQFGQGLGRPDANGKGNAGALLHPLADEMAIALQVAAAASGQIQEGFVDRVDFHFRGVLLQDGHDPSGHVAVEGVIGGIDLDGRLGKLLAHLKEGQAHGDAQGFGFFGASNDAAIIVGEYDHGLAAQSGLKDALTGDVEVVAVDQREDRGHGR